MPPPSSKKTLSAAEKKVLADWIAQGGEYQAHWAYVPVVKHAAPAVKQQAWVKNAVDHFILARLEKEGLKPNGPEELTRLLRRVTLDLTGLPPTPAEVDGFLKECGSANRPGLTCTSIFSNNHDHPRAVALQGDKILTVGVTRDASLKTLFAFTRHLADGSFDRTFSGNGRTSVELKGHGAANAVALQQLPGEPLRIVLAGNSYETSDGTNSAGIARLWAEHNN